MSNVARVLLSCQGEFVFQLEPVNYIIHLCLLKPVLLFLPKKVITEIYCKTRVEVVINFAPRAELTKL